MSEDQTGQQAAPEHVAIVGLGPSAQAYIDLVERFGSRHACFDETWVVNTYGSVLAHDRCFLMDDVANLEREAVDESLKPEVRLKLTNLLAWLRTHPGPVYTSIKRDGYPGLIAYPLEEVIASVGTAYFNNTVAYATVHAIHLGVKRISLFGCDYSYGKDQHEGTGRACVEFWMGVAAARGIHISVAQTSTLMDACRPERKFYGYESVEIAITPNEEGKPKLTMTPRKEFLASVDLESR